MPVYAQTFGTEGSEMQAVFALYYEGRSISSEPDLVLFRIKLKYYLLLIVARLRTWHAQYDWAINILCILAYERSVCQMGVENANTKLYTSFWRTSRKIPTWPSKNLYHNSLFRMKCASTTSILSQNTKHAIEQMNRSKLSFYITLCNSVFSMSNANNRWPLKCTKYL